MKEEIVDETDVYVDVHKRYIELLAFFYNLALELFIVLTSSYGYLRIRVAAVAAASSVARGPANRKLVQKVNAN